MKSTTKRLAAVARRSERYGIDPERWPYGPNIDPEMASRMLDWAEKYGLMLSAPNQECLHWLLKGRCARPTACRQWTWMEQPWMDHPSCWTYQGRPAVLVAQPYGLSDASRSVLAGLNSDKVHVEVRDRGWYGHCTVWVGLWSREVWNQLK